MASRSLHKRNVYQVWRKTVSFLQTDVFLNDTCIDCSRRGELLYQYICEKGTLITMQIVIPSFAIYLNLLRLQPLNTCTKQINFNRIANHRPKINDIFLNINSLLSCEYQGCVARVWGRLRAKSLITYTVAGKQVLDYYTLLYYVWMFRFRNTRRAHK